jgi:hypothetical protein
MKIAVMNFIVLLISMAVCKAVPMGHKNDQLSRPYMMKSERPLGMSPGANDSTTRYLSTKGKNNLVKNIHIDSYVSIPLGECLLYSVLSGTTSTFDGVTSRIYTGDVGVSPGTSITGSYELYDGSVERTTSSAALCATDLAIAYSAASSTTCTVTLASAELTGLTLSPGVYCSPTGTMNLAGYGTVTLDALNDATSQWVLQTRTTVVTGGYSSIVAANGALSSNVYWAVGSSATIGGYSKFVGSILSSVSITMDTRAALDGRALATVATTCASACQIALPAASCVVTYPSGNTDSLYINLGECVYFTVLSGTTSTFDGEKSKIMTGDVGVSPGTSITGSYELYDGSIEIDTTSSDLCAIDMAKAYRSASYATCTVTFVSAELTGLTLSPGVYCTATGTMNLAAYASVTLDASNDDSAQWVMQTISTVVTGSYSSIVLANGAVSSNVYWAVGSSATIGSYSTFIGTILSLVSITLNSFSTVDGRALALAATTCASGCTMTMPASSLGTAVCSVSPTTEPTATPSFEPTAIPSYESTPTPSFVATATPSFEPTATPSFQPTATATTATATTATPSFQPSATPTTATPSLEPSATPTTATPSLEPTATPTTATPTTATPTFQPTANPTTAAPSLEPTATPTTAIPSLKPTATPSFEPTATPTTATLGLEPTATPSLEPTATSSFEPTATPSFEPTATPSLEPTATPTTATPSFQPTVTPSLEPTATPTTATPSLEPTATPAAGTSSLEPKATPSFQPSATPTTATPTIQPTATPTTAAPSLEPTATPSFESKATPTIATPSFEPTATPSLEPTATPTGMKTFYSTSI